MANKISLCPSFVQLHMKPRITAGQIFKMAEGPMSLRPRNVVDCACDNVGTDTHIRKKEAEERKNLTMISVLLATAIVDPNGYLAQQNQK